jgi:hypothetical protein
MATENKDAVLIGSKMEGSDFIKARASVGGSLYQPKSDGQYSGKVVMWTDTHIVQKVGEKTGIIHDRATLDKASQASLSKSIETGKIATEILKVSYDSSQGKTQTFNYAQDQVNRTANNLNKAIDNFTKKPAQKEMLAAFVKHWNEATVKSLDKAPAQAAPEQKQEQAQKPASPKR